MGPRETEGRLVTPSRDRTRRPDSPRGILEAVALLTSAWPPSPAGPQRRPPREGGEGWRHADDTGESGSLAPRAATKAHGRNKTVPLFGAWSCPIY